MKSAKKHTGKDSRKPKSRIMLNKYLHPLIVSIMSNKYVQRLLSCIKPREYLQQIGAYIKTDQFRKSLIMNIPYIVAFIFADRASCLLRISEGENFSERMLYAMANSRVIIQSFMPQEDYITGRQPGFLKKQNPEQSIWAVLETVILKLWKPSFRAVPEVTVWAVQEQPIWAVPERPILPFKNCRFGHLL